METSAADTELTERCVVVHDCFEEVFARWPKHREKYERLVRENEERLRLGAPHEQPLGITLLQAAPEVWIFTIRVSGGVPAYETFWRRSVDMAERIANGFYGPKGLKVVLLRRQVSS